MSLQKVRKAAWTGVCLTAVVLVAVLSGCGSSSSGDEAILDGSGYPGVDAANTREAKGTIDSSNVAELEEAWSLPLTAQSSYGAHSSSPVIVNGVIYSQDLESNVQAIDLESGEVLWTKKYEEADEGPNGVVVAEGMVFGATPKAAFALDQETGKEVWSTPLVTHPTGEGIDMAPGYSDGLVYVSTVPLTATAAYPGGGVGTLWALDAKTGNKKWHFDTVPKSLWGDKKVNSGGGLWQPPSFDGKGSIYFGTGNPAPYPGTPQEPWGSSRPGPNLYTNSLVKLDAADRQDGVVLPADPARHLRLGLPGPAAADQRRRQGAGGGSGQVGRRRRPRRQQRQAGLEASGRHPQRPRRRQPLRDARANTRRSSRAKCLPGVLGGVIAPMATDGKTIFVPVVNLAASITASGELGEGGSPPTGELVAIDAASGRIVWNQEFNSALFGAPTVVNDLVFATSFEGSVHAFDTSNGGELWVGTLPASINTSVSIADDTVIAPAGLASAEGQTPEIVAFRLGG